MKKDQVNTQNIGLLITMNYIIFMLTQMSLVMF